LTAFIFISEPRYRSKALTDKHIMNAMRVTPR
jgi:hypothetical protein